MQSILDGDEEEKLWYNPKLMTDSSKKVKAKLATILTICFLFILIELIGAKISNSIAIFTDVAHLFSDLLGFLFSYISVTLSTRKASDKMSFGLVRAEIIGALSSVIIIWAMSIWIAYEAIVRMVKIINHETILINPKAMLITSFLGFLINLIMAFCLHGEGHGHSHGKHKHKHSHGEHNHDHNHDHDHDHEDHEELEELEDHDEENRILNYEKNEDEEEHELLPLKKNGKKNLSSIKSGENQNIRAALVHIIGDMVQSLGVILASSIIFFNPTWIIVDPFISIMFTTIAISFSIPVIREIITLLMDSTPGNLDIFSFKDDLKKIKFVEEIHDIHVWNLSFGKPNMTAHIICSAHTEYVLKKATLICREVGIYHSTIQVELNEAKYSINCKHNLHT